METKYHLLKGNGSKNSFDVERQQRKSVCYYEIAEIILFCPSEIDTGSKTSWLLTEMPLFFSLNHSAFAVMLIKTAIKEAAPGLHLQPPAYLRGKTKKHQKRECLQTYSLSFLR